jgi:hypothetical protein
MCPPGAMQGLLQPEGNAKEASRNIAFNRGSCSKSDSDPVGSPKHLPSLIFEYRHQLTAAALPSPDVGYAADARSIACAPVSLN